MQHINRIFCGDSSLMPEIPDESIDSLVTDPPSGIAFMGLDWDKDKGGRGEWISWFSGVMREAYRTMKPGAHGLVWSLPRTQHWTATALEDAGFEIKDTITHLYASGFPKSQDISKMIDKMAGAERKVIGIKPGHETTAGRNNLKAFNGAASRWASPWMKDDERVLAYHMATEPATDDARKWSGWGTALKPASENWVLVRKPLSEKTIAANVLKHGSGALNIDGSRIAWAGEGDKPSQEEWNGKGSTGSVGANGYAGQFSAEMKKAYAEGKISVPAGRWPANVVFSHNAACGDTCADNCAVAELDRQSEDCGGASRFFYVAKPAVSEKNANIGDHIETTASRTMGGGYMPDGNGNCKSTKNTHPTVKPLALMQYFIRLITPPGGIVLDNFSGSGTTLIAADSMGFKWVGYEQSPEYVKIIEARLSQRSIFSA